MRKTVLLSFFSLAILAAAQNSTRPVHAPSPVAPRPSSAAFAAMETINPERIRAHVRFLSHDLLEGRGTGQRGRRHRRRVHRNPVRGLWAEARG